MPPHLSETARTLSTRSKRVCGSDMMSDVLAFIKKDALLLTGLNSLQADIPQRRDAGYRLSGLCAGQTTAGGDAADGG